MAAVDASIYRTTVTTTEIENESTGSHQMEKCQREMQGVQLNECRRYLEQSQRGILMMSTNPMRQVPEQCCSEMREVTEESADQMHGGEYEREEMREMMQKAKQLPSMCGMGPQYCDIPGYGY
ncbi:hypothetical protein BVC80_8751g16 [Macleaya cordata]|uniref:Bifunctional inhibitor/plant lipid transfer protein/seed storage helical domain-containing protein n=1 Tax=Macleaya cordata TaxID=56857 RepID=A0A200QKH3_MACCD|nr:hypothetical protein BVC80_8751g16 [Macleaya cordata]